MKMIMSGIASTHRGPSGPLIVIETDEQAAVVVRPVITVTVTEGLKGPSTTTILETLIAAEVVEGAKGIGNETVIAVETENVTGIGKVEIAGNDTG